MAVIGIDFDNTIACYDRAFHSVAAAQGLVASSPVLSKRELKQYLCQFHGEECWTRLQGQVYGPEIRQATPFPGVLDFVNRAIARGWTLAVISHKTRQPVLGEAWDLHAFAYKWLKDHGFLQAGLSSDKVFFEETRAAKLARIAQCNCDIFIDDLPEVMLEANFPTQVERWLFYPQTISGPWRQFEHWHMAAQWLVR